MTVELINTGAELLLGRRLNTHQQWLCRRLTDLGSAVTRQVAVADESGPICEAVRDALGRVDVVITTGGLGPTSDDLTRESLCGLLGRTLIEDPEVLAGLERFFRQRGRPLLERARVQAQVPEGAVVLPNAKGTAPGLAIELESNPFRAGTPAGLLILLPGPPRELQPMFDTSVVPLLERWASPMEPFVCETLRTTGVPESSVQELIEEPLRSWVAKGLGVAYCARPGEVDVRLSAQGEGAERVVAAGVEVVLGLVGEHCYTRAEEELESVVVGLLVERGLSIAVAESCTGGLIMDRITNVPGASAVLAGGWVTYANEAKQQWLGVNAGDLARHGAVSESVARQMAEGARRRAGADLAVAATGIAGPGGGTDEKPVGTVYLAVATAGGTTVVRRRHPFDRLTFKAVTAQQALDLVRRSVLGLALA